jgi:hypothetical protein
MQGTTSSPVQVEAINISHSRDHNTQRMSSVGLHSLGSGMQNTASQGARSNLSRWRITFPHLAVVWFPFEHLRGLRCKPRSMVNTVVAPHRCSCSPFEHTSLLVMLQKHVAPGHKTALPLLAISCGH